MFRLCVFVLCAKLVKAVSLVMKIYLIVLSVIGSGRGTEFERKIDGCNTVSDFNI